MSRIPKPHEIYKHFKGNLYQILAVAEHSETGEQLVIYQAMYGEFKIYARPLENFLSQVDKGKYPDSAQTYRFERQGESQEQTIEPEMTLPQTAKAQHSYEMDETADVGAHTVSETEELHIDPMVLQFLEADTYEERLAILVAIQSRITDDMITTMAIACDVEVPEGSLEERYLGLKNCLVTLEKYECNRLR